MNGEYVRVTAGELARCIDEPVWAKEFVETVQAEEEEADLPPDKARYLSTHKAWHAIAYLLERALFPVDIVYGEETLAEDEDWGYGPPRYLTADHVRLAANALVSTSYDALTAHVNRTALAQAAIYPQIWDEPDSIEWVRGWYEPLVPFFADAAKQGQAMLIWLV
jgi:Domain of unknown function (DUF1877)